MARAERTEIMQANAEDIFNVLKDYESYSEFMEGVASVEVLERDGNKVQAKYNINMIKKFSYIINLVEEAPNKLSWTLDSGDLFTKNIGEWLLKDLGDGTTEVTYSLDVELKLMVPKMISKKLVSTSLPAMMKSVENRAING